MADIPNTNDQKMFEIMQEIDEKSIPNKNRILNMNGLNTEYAHSNKWWMYIPVSNVLGKKFANLELNLVRFSIP